jgi:GT2 family glycosyltransferase
VRQALTRTCATVFARETASLRETRPLCDARLAHDCAFFFNFDPYKRPGIGTLNAFRLDPEGLGHELPAGNHDISRDVADLQEWLELISAHAMVRTDRAHVMIAAALMGKSVQAAATRYHKIPSLVTTWLRQFPVELISVADGPGPPAGKFVRPAMTVPSQAPSYGARVTAVVVSRDRPESLRRAVRSVTGSEEVERVVVFDSNSDPAGRPQLSALEIEDDRVLIRRSERDLGRAGGRRQAAELADTEFVLFLEDSVELGNGTIGPLVAELDAAPDGAGVTPVVVDPAGTVLHYGGELNISAEVAEFVRGSTGARADAAELPPSGRTSWLPASCALVRTSVLRDIPIDDQMVPAYEDAEWSYRAIKAGHALRRCREAVVIQHPDRSAGAPSSQLVACALRVERLPAMARFCARHHLLLGMNLSEVGPELQLPDGTTDFVALRRLLELVDDRGVDWTISEWMNGGLVELLAGPPVPRLSRLAGQLRGRLTRFGLPSAVRR